MHHLSLLESSTGGAGSWTRLTAVLRALDPCHPRPHSHLLLHLMQTSPCLWPIRPHLAASRRLTPVCYMLLCLSSLPARMGSFSSHCLYVQLSPGRAWHRVRSKSTMQMKGANETKPQGWGFRDQPTEKKHDYLGGQVVDSSKTSKTLPKQLCTLSAPLLHPP